MRGFRPGATEVGFDFELEPGRVRIDLDNMVRLALDGLRDAGVVARGRVGVERIVATKRPRAVPGLGISLAWSAIPDDDDPFVGNADLVATGDTVPRDESPSEKLAWRDAIAAVWSRPPVTKAVGVDIAVLRATSLASTLKPVTDGLEPYLGQEPLGRRTLRPRDEQVAGGSLLGAGDQSGGNDTDLAVGGALGGRSISLRSGPHAFRPAAASHDVQREKVRCVIPLGATSDVTL
jgi:hypothetical protein